jgi:hypothetical protein
MKKKILILCGVLIFIWVGMGLVQAQDPGNRDTLWIERINMDQTIVGQSGKPFSVKCSVYTDQGLAAFKIPLTFYHDRNKDVYVDSVKYESWVSIQTASVIGFQKHNENSGDTAKTFLFGAVWFTDSIPPTHPTQKLFCNIWFHTGSPYTTFDTTKSIVLDTCAYNGEWELEFVDFATATSYKPIFVPGAIGYPRTISGTVISASLPCAITVSGDRRKNGLTDSLGNYSFAVGKGGRWSVFRDSSICSYDFNPLLRDTAGINFIGVSCSLQTCFSPQHFVFTNNTGSSYSLVIDSAYWEGVELDECSEVGVFDDTGGGMLCVGASVYHPRSLTVSLIAWKDDPWTGVKDGYTSGDTTYFKVWSKNHSREESASSHYLIGNGRFESGAFSKLWLTFLRGDVNADAKVGLRDVIYLANYSLKGGSPPVLLSSGDVNCDDKINLVDVIALARYVMLHISLPC